MSKKEKRKIEEKRDNWFVDYHDIPELGIEGKRKINDRVQHYDRNDFLDATVIDLGCNMGQMSFQAEKWGAKQVVGVEYDSSAVINANEIKDKLKSNVTFVVDDLDSNFLCSFKFVGSILSIVVGTVFLFTSFMCLRSSIILYP